MKKFLSLVLALVMTMSLVTISAGAKDFTDDSKATYVDAIEVMSELKVIDGYTDGSFRPTTELNRGAAAKIICNMILGPTTASALSASSAPFVDVPADSVFAGYITYCAKEGIINGYADGSFRPTAPLTGYAFMKMLLGALGYDPAVEGYTGANWGVNVAKQAIGLGLDDGNDEFVGTNYVTREEACLYALNTLKTTMVEYGDKTTINIDGVEVVVGGSEAKEMKHTGTDANINKADTFKKDGKVQFAEMYFKTLTTKDVVDDFGRPSSEWKIKNKSVGVYTDEAAATYTTGVKGKTIYADVNADLSDTTWTAFVDGVAVDFDDLKAGFDVTKKNSKEIAGNGVLTQVFYDEDKDAGVITLINTYLVQVDGEYDEDDEVLELDEIENYDCELPTVDMTLTSDDFDGLDEFEDEDYVLVTVAAEAVEDEDKETVYNQYIASIALAEMVSGTVTEHVEEESVTMDDTDYSFAATNPDPDFDYEIDEDYELYLDAYGYVLMGKGVEAAAKYVFVEETGKSSNMQYNSKVLAYSYFVDGTVEEITVAKLDGEKVTGADADPETGKFGQKNWYKYTEKDGKYNLTLKDIETLGGKIPAGDKVVDYSDDALKTYIDYGTDTIKANKETVFVVAGDDVDVYTGIKNVPAITGAAAGKDATEVYVVAEDGYAAYVMIYLNDGEAEGSDKSTDVIFLTGFDKSGTDSADNDYYRYKAVVNGELDQKVKFENVEEELGYGLYVNVEYDAETGYVSDYDVVGVDSVDKDDFDVQTVTGIESQKAGVITMVVVTEEGTEENARYYLSDEGYDIFTVKVVGDKVDSVKTVSARTLADDFAAKAATVYGVKNADGDYTALYYVYEA